MYYTAGPNTEQLFLAGLNIQEDLYRKELTKRIFEFLERHVSLVTGSVIDVAPEPRQYFSKASRFLVLSIQGFVDRDKQTGLMNTIKPLLNGVFINDEGQALQPYKSQADSLPEGTYYLEQISLTGSPLCTIGNLSENQLHLINLPNS
jgi:hypothetical protein